MTTLNPTLHPEIQEIILDALPENGAEAIEVMCQMLANITLSVAGPRLEEVCEKIRTYFDLYERSLS